MLISVDNFKSISHVVDIDLTGLTVLAGVNSSGKSSLIQVLLLLKQTLDRQSSYLLNLSGPYVFTDSLMDLIHNKKSGIMGFSIRVLKDELEGTSIQDFISNKTPIDYLEVSVTFRVKNRGSYQVSGFKLVVKYGDGEEILDLTKVSQRNKYNLRYEGKEYRNIVLDEYSFANFFPVFIKYNDTSFDLPIVKAARETLITVLAKLAYIAPLRVAPVLARTYLTDVKTNQVNPDGENTRFILDKLANEDRPRLEMIKEWICKKFHLAKDLNVVKESGKRFRVVVTTNEDVTVDLMHMGFGISQILPIITQGCISAQNSLLIVEDPDVHMHPSIQASMADFFLYLCKERGVSVLVETHSDHFVTRLRRRVAEGDVSADMIHLIFVEMSYGESLYQSIPLSAHGRLLGSMPAGFMDTLDKDFRAILEAGRK